MKNIVFFLLFVLFSRVGYAQRLTFENIGVKSGLPASEVYHVFEDKQGYMWFFTEYGIVKYNGTEFIPVCKNLSVDNSAVYAVTESSGGNVYFANSKGNIYRVFHDRAYLVKSKKLNRIQKFFKKTGLLISNIYLDKKGTMWISTFFESYSIKRSEYFTPGLPRDKPQKSGKNGTFVVKIHDKSKSTSRLSLIKVFNRIDVLSDVKFSSSFFKEIKENVHARGRANFKVTDNAWYGGYSTNLYIKRVGRKGKEIDVGAEVIAFDIAENGHIWAGTHNGLREFDENLNCINVYLENLVVSDVNFDSHGGMWATTIGFGVFHCPDIKQESYSEVIRKDERISMLKRMDNQLYIGTFSGKLYAKEGKEIHQIPLGIKTVGINDLKKKNGSYYLGSNLGFFILNMKNGMKPAYANNGYSIYGIESFDEDNLVLISGFITGGYNLTTKKENFFGRHSRTRGVLKRLSGEILTMSNDGVCIVTLNERKFPKYLDSLKNASPSKMRLDNQGNVWFCTRDHGLYCLNVQNKLSNIKILPDHVLKNILFLKDGKVILATNKGGFISNVNDMKVNSSWKKIIDEEILELEEYQGRIYFGSKVGLFSIEESKFKDKEKHCFYLRSVRTNSGNFEPGHVSKFSRDQNELYFDYDFLNYKQKSRIINYELNGPIAQKGIVPGNTLHLQNLIPGVYKLEVSPELPNGGKSDVKITKYFSIEPAIWETLTFRIIFFVLSMLIVLLIYRFFANRQINRKRAREAIEKQLNEYRLTALKSQINPHFMSNSLVAIQHLILQNETDNANLYLAKFSLLLRSLLDYSNKSSASLASELHLIELYVELEQLRFSNKFIFELDIDPSVELDEVIIPTLITQPFVENAIWHGLLPLKEHSNARLTLRIMLDKDDLKISIIDNGVGREYHKALRKKRSSKGSALIVSRLETLNQLYSTTGSKIEFEDLYDKNDQPSGTCVTIVLPGDILNELYDGKNS